MPCSNQNSFRLTNAHPLLHTLEHQHRAMHTLLSRGLRATVYLGNSQLDLPQCYKAMDSLAVLRVCQPRANEAEHSSSTTSKIPKALTVSISRHNISTIP
jgi:hypothetical protein